MQVAIVHDDLMQWGGAEKVLVAISEVFPDAPIYTTLVNWRNPFILKHFKNRIVKTSFLQKLPLSDKLYKPLFPLHPIAFEQFDFTDYDLVVSQTTRFAKSVITKPDTKHVCYIHTPPRFLWNFRGGDNPYLKNPLFNWLRRFDLVTAKRVDKWIAGSENCKTRLRKIYKVDSEVLYPFVDTNDFNPQKNFLGDYYLIISRLNKYKNVEIAVNAFKQNGKKLKIIGTGPEFENLLRVTSENIEILGKVSDELLESLLAGCLGLIITAEEDFGMTSIEAQSFGKGVIAYGAGGSLETIIPGKTGNFFNEKSSQSLNKAIEVFESLKIKPEDCWANAQNFSKKKFKEQLLKLVK